MDLKAKGVLFLSKDELICFKVNWRKGISGKEKKRFINCYGFKKLNQ